MKNVGKIISVVFFISVCSVFAKPFEDGDVVVFLGDSITHGGRYHEFVADFYRTRYPERKIRFINSGIGGDSAHGAQGRICNDVEVYTPTHVAIHFGMNDVGRGNYRSNPCVKTLKNRVKAMDGWKYNMKTLVNKLKKSVPGAELIYFTTTPYDDTAVVTNMPAGAKGWAVVNQIGCNGALALMAGHVAVTAERDGAHFVDFYTPLNSFLVQRRKKDPHFMITRWDRVHPEALGHSIMAWAFLESQNVSPVVSDVEIDAKTLKVVKSVNAVTDGISVGDGNVTFSVLPNSLPFPVDEEALPYIKEFRVEEKFNFERVAVKGLSSGRYEVCINGDIVGEWSSEELEKGILLGFNPKTPQYRHAQEVFKKQKEASFNEKRVRDCHYARLAYSRRTDVDDVKKFAEWFEKNEKNKKSFFAKFVPEYLEYWPRHEETHERLWKDHEAVRGYAKPRKLVYKVRIKN